MESAPNSAGLARKKLPQPPTPSLPPKPSPAKHVPPDAVAKVASSPASGASSPLACSPEAAPSPVTEGRFRPDPRSLRSDVPNQPRRAARVTKMGGVSMGVPLSPTQLRSAIKDVRMGKCGGRGRGARPASVGAGNRLPTGPTKRQLESPPVRHRVLAAASPVSHSSKMLSVKSGRSKPRHDRTSVHTKPLPVPGSVASPLPQRKEARCKSPQPPVPHPKPNVRLSRRHPASVSYGSLPLPPSRFDSEDPRRSSSSGDVKRVPRLPPKPKTRPALPPKPMVTRRRSGSYHRERPPMVAHVSSSLRSHRQRDPRLSASAIWSHDARAGEDEEGADDEINIVDGYEAPAGVVSSSGSSSSSNTKYTRSGRAITMAAYEAGLDAALPLIQARCQADEVAALACASCDRGDPFLTFREEDVLYIKSQRKDHWWLGRRGAVQRSGRYEPLEVKPGSKPMLVDYRDVELLYHGLSTAPDYYAPLQAWVLQSSSSELLATLSGVCTAERLKLADGFLTAFDAHQCLVHRLIDVVHTNVRAAEREEDVLRSGSAAMVLLLALWKSKCYIWMRPAALAAIRFLNGHPVELDPALLSPEESATANASHVDSVVKLLVKTLASRQPLVELCNVLASLREQVEQRWPHNADHILARVVWGELMGPVFTYPQHYGVTSEPATKACPNLPPLARVLTCLVNLSSEDEELPPSMAVLQPSIGHLRADFASLACKLLSKACLPLPPAPDVPLEQTRSYSCWCRIHRSLSFCESTIVSAFGARLSPAHAEDAVERLRAMLRPLGPPPTDHLGLLSLGSAGGASRRRSMAAYIGLFLQSRPSREDVVARGILTAECDEDLLFGVKRVADISSLCDESHPVLNLNSCRLNVAPDLSRMASYLQTLVMSHNVLQRIPSLRELPSLTHLDVSHNKIEIIELDEVYSGVWDRLKVLRLEGNPFAFPLSFLRHHRSVQDSLYFLKNVNFVSLLAAGAHGHLELESAGGASLRRWLASGPSTLMSSIRMFVTCYQQHPQPQLSGQVQPLVQPLSLSFGYTGDALAPVMRSLDDTIVIHNTTGERIRYRVSMVSPPSAVINCDTQEGSIAKGKKVKVKISLCILSTVDLRDAIVVHFDHPALWDQFVPIRVVSERTYVLDSSAITILEEIGSGGGGKVYKATLHGKYVALKRNMEYTQEAELMKQLCHPHIITFYGTMRSPPDPSSPFVESLVMEYASLGSLSECLSDRTIRLSWKLRVKMALDLARALAYLHAFPVPVVHRDVKSHNCLLFSMDPMHDVNIKLCDFGTTKKLSPTMTGSQGTALWMAPETYANKPYDEKADVYSFGVVLIELMCRTHPWLALGFADMVRSLDAGKTPPVPETAPAEVVSIANECTSIAPNRRPSMQFLVRQFNKLYSRDDWLASLGED